jgi:vacuolar-type H+-ATPase subunit I/STV1
LRKIGPQQSTAVKHIAEKIKQTYVTFRILIRKYNENVEVVDPQLKNNSELVEVLSEFEKAWTLGKEHLLDATKFHHLVILSKEIEATAIKHK